MKTFRILRPGFRCLALAAIAAFALWQSPAQTAPSTPLQQQILCGPEVSGATTGSRTIGGTLSAVPSGTIYGLNGQGCALVKLQDVPYFQSQGYTTGANLFSIQSTGAVTSAASATSVQIGVLPAGAYISAIMLNEILGAAITGGVDIGTTSTGTDFASAVALGANALVMVADSALTRVVGVTGTPTAKPIFVTCHTSCNAGSVTVTVLYSYF